MMRQVLQTGCLIAGILCLFYFVLIMSYVKHTEWFQFVWLTAGMLFLSLWRLMAYLQRHELPVLQNAVNLLFVLIAAGVLVMGYFGSQVIRGMTLQPRQNLEYVIVLGAQVRGTQPSRALRKRLDCALEYAQNNPNTVFILSGGQGSDEEISEAQCMYTYMAEHGMDVERLLMEERSTSTKENLRFSAKLLDKEKNQIGVLSNNFHIHRALLLAAEEGYRQVYGIPALSDPVMQLHYLLREICALLVIQIRK